jgi:DNA (cytosine-5)-methyltransferase 1
LIVGVDSGKGVWDAPARWPRGATIESHLIKYYGSGIAVSADRPLDTVTTRDRFGLVQGLVAKGKDGKKYLIDVRLRMLQPAELAAAQGFPKKYAFAGTRAVKIKQIGNAVPVHMAKALAAAVLTN